MKKRILFFTENLRSGGKERRLVELLFYLKQNTNYQIQLVLTEKEIHYTYIENLGIPIKIIKRHILKKDPLLFFRFFKIAKEFKPDIIHTWGTMSTFYAIPTKLLLKRPLIANLVANAKRDFKNWSISQFFFKLDCRFSEIILGNSNAGLNVYNITPPKRKLIYNGVRLERFNIKVDKNQVRKQINIKTPYIIIMVASASKNKDYDFFLDVAKIICNQRNDVSFIGVGNGSELLHLIERVKLENIKNVILTGKRIDVENLISIADIGVLFSPCEGISNSIIEYMALGKPVITTDIAGGSREIIENGESGYILNNNISEIIKMINKLLNNKELRYKMGEEGKKIISTKFSIEKMGHEFINIYEDFI